MDLSYDVVASKCAQQMAQYQECVQKNQDGDWSSICRPEGKALAACADASVPHLAEMKEACAKPIAAYRTCLEDNANAPDIMIQATCGQLMKDLWECSEKVVEGIEQREGAFYGSPPAGRKV